MKPEVDKEREKRIQDEVLADNYDSYEVKTAWDCYLSDNISFPFTAKVKVKDKQGNETLVAVEVVSFDEKNR